MYTVVDNIHNIDISKLAIVCTNMGFDVIKCDDLKVYNILSNDKDVIPCRVMFMRDFFKERLRVSKKETKILYVLKDINNIRSSLTENMEKLTI